MEELFAYAYLMEIGFSFKNMYEEKLNELFILYPDNEDLLELEFLSSNIKESIIYIKTHIDYTILDHNKLGKKLMCLLKPLYKSMDIHSFSNCMYSLWKNLADDLQDKEPFFALSYADDPLSWGDEKQTRQLYEKMLSYYDN